MLFTQKLITVNVKLLIRKSQKNICEKMTFVICQKISAHTDMSFWFFPGNSPTLLVPHCFLLSPFIYSLSLKTFPDNACKREILTLQVHCDNYASGCEWIGQLKRLEVNYWTADYAFFRYEML